MNLFADIDFTIKLETTELSSLYLDLLEPKEEETLAKQTKQKPKKKSRRQGKSNYHWTRVQQKRYIDFLLQNLSCFDLSSNDRRTMGINSKMSRTIKSRDTNQCRSHHQKMLTKFGSVDMVVRQFEHLLCPRNLKKWNQLYLNGRQWKVLEDSICSENESVESFEREKCRERMCQSEVVHFFDPQHQSLIEEDSIVKEQFF